MQHILHHQCIDADCFLCSNGWLVCSICHGTGTSLTSECSGEPMEHWQAEAVQKKHLDFKNGHWFDPRYRGYVGTWEVVSPGMQFKTTAQRVLGAIWFKSREEIWCAQRYIDDATVHYFRLQRDAELYVKAVDEESRLIALEACHAS